MRHSSIKAGALAFALGGFAFAGHAVAVSPLPLNDVAPLAVPVVDQEEQAVEEHLNADEMPAPSQDQAAKNTAPAGAGEATGKSGGDVEQHDLQNAFPSTDWPKK